MRTMYKYLLGLALPLLCWACTDTEFANVSQTLTEGRASVTLNISTPESFSTRTRAISEDNESVLDDKFAVFAFNYVSGDTLLLFTVKSGDVNSESNLDGDNTYTSAYGDYTSSPSIAWHEDASGTGGRLYIEYDETDGPIHLLVLANVDLEKVEALLTPEAGSTEPAIYEGMTFSAVTAALEPALDYDVTDEDLTSIPMAGECELENGITLGSTGSISLRRSVAKFTVRVEYSRDRVENEYEGIDNVPFSPDSIQITNLNATYATVYAPYVYDSDGVLMPHVSTLNENIEYSPMLYFDENSEWILDEENEVYYKEVVFFVAETVNSRQAAYTVNPDGSFTQNTTNPRISVLVGGTYNDNDDTVLERNWYRLDLIPESAESADEEYPYILRNHNYRFVISDVDKRGSSSELEALELQIPDNEPFSEGEGIYVDIEDEDIISITVDSNTADENGQPYYVGVSSTEIELNTYWGNIACARVKVETNFDDWTIDFYSIPYATDEQGNPLTDTDGSPIYAISFVWDSESNTLWLWLDYPDDVTVGDTYAYYIVAGNIRKKMRITIIYEELEE